ncbi:type II toxin-antitoxin system death-on-curing family toxin [Bacillus sp. IITD106]|nr:type II toxin-antitoxin system death-on-curing family toxin [Bacillus sp. IITD106]
MTRFLTEKEVIFLNALVIKRYTPSEEIRVKDQNLLDSAIHRPQQSAFGEDAYPTIWLKAAALFESISKNHAFVGGNKRTGFASLYQFLWLNGYRLMVDEKEAENFTVDMVKIKPTIPLEEIAEWIEKHSERKA